MYLLSLLRWIIAPSFAQELEGNYSYDPESLNGIDPCPMAEVPCIDNGSGAARDFFAQTVVDTFANPLILAAGGLFLLALTIYGYKLLVGGFEENTSTEAKQGFGHAVAAAVVIGAATTFTSVFATQGSFINNSGELIGVGVSVINAIVLSVYSLLLITIFVQALRLVTALEESNKDKAVKLLGNAAVGAMLVAISNILLGMFLTGGTIGLRAQIRGIAEFTITIFSALCFVAVVVSGIMMVSSLDEGLKEKAKKTLVGAIVTIFLVYGAFSVLVLFL